ncbi:helix-turn-helix transcriptional regulator [Salinimicrobium soli]|uniref:helix-turn-helix transcriptional regulator n=1 Tax=Salinimicrobium soli TaxID=1254399 RepID=UPI003AAAB772
MVNIEEFTNRINKVMEYYDLSAASFADKIDVGRSSISHLLSGRNKPSLDFVMKIVKTFPEVDIYWLLNGKGNFPKKDVSPASLPKVNPAITPDLFTEELSIPASPEKNSSKGRREIKKIVFFYNDGSFEAFEN